ncbi:MAG: deoxyribose-phosphate aldolase [Ruminococcaceae bacterium]|nr:deoxyribose-phosphate aldolase [Oscillospiraceae bacterium]
MITDKKLISLLSMVDHTLLSITAQRSEYIKLCDDGMKYKTASVCIPASRVGDMYAYMGNELPICTVIGFPNGYSTAASKIFEAEDAIKNGAREIDTVINIGLLKEKRYKDILTELKDLKKACGENILKVIIETCLLTEEEKIAMCDIVSESGADFIKTSTGFSISGATKEDVILFKKHCAPHVRIKAAGGISSLEDAYEFVSLGAVRLGTSRIVKAVKEMETNNR